MKCGIRKGQRLIPSGSDFDSSDPQCVDTGMLHMEVESRVTLQVRSQHKLRIKPASEMANSQTTTLPGFHIILDDRQAARGSRGLSLDFGLANTNHLSDLTQ